LIKNILDVYSTLTTQAAVTNLVKSHKKLENHHVQLFTLLCELKSEFQKIAADRKAELAAARAAKKKTRDNSEEDEDEEMAGESEENQSGVEGED
jgi:hypothetical protein